MLPRYLSLLVALVLVCSGLACDVVIKNELLLDAGGIDSSLQPQPDASEPCSWSAFSEPTPVSFAGENPANPNSPSITEDGLEIYFTAIYQTVPRIWRARRDTPSGVFLTAEPILTLGESVGDYSPGISPDGSSLFLARRDGDTNIYVADLDPTTKAFTTAKLVEGVNSEADDMSLWINPAGTWAVFQSDRNAEYHSELWFAERASRDDAFSEPSLIPGLDPESSYMGPSASADTLTLLFSTSREHSNAKGSSDIWIANRATPTSSFAEPTPVAEVNSAGYDMSPWLSPDGSTILFYSNRGNLEASDSLLYQTTRSCN